MKTRWPLCGILSGLLLLPTFVLVAQEPPATPEPPPSPAAVAKPQAAAEPSLAEKLKLARLSPSAREVIKMADSGMDSALLQSYVENSSSVYSLSSDDVIFLHERGIPSSVITAMLQRSAKVRDQAAANTPPPAPPAPAPVYQQPAQQPAPTYVVQQPAPAPIIVPGPSYTHATTPNVVIIGSRFSGSHYPRSYAPYFHFRYSRGWDSPFYYRMYGHGYCP